MDPLAQLLASLDNVETPLSEEEIYQLLNNYKQANPALNSHVLDSELIAFAFWERFDIEKKKAFYQPLWSCKMEDGTAQSFPELIHITCETLDYWYQRAVATIHPVLKMRYAGLTWEFYKAIKKSKPPIEMSKIIIDSVILISDKYLHKHEQSIVTKFQYGLSLALSIKNNQHTTNMTHAILEYEEKAVKKKTVADAWFLSFDHLLTNNKIFLTEEQKNKIIARLEMRLDNLLKTIPMAGGIFSIKKASIRLAKFYQKTSQVEKMKLVLKKYMEATLHFADLASPIVSQVWLSETLAHANQFNLIEEEKQISIKLLEVNQRLGKHLNTTAVNTKISAKDMEKFLEQMAEGSLNDCLERLRNNSLINKNNLQQQVFDLAKDHPVSYLIRRSIPDHKGRVVAVVGPLSDDLEGHLIWQASINTKIYGFLRRTAISRIFTKHQPTAELLTNYIFRSPIFEAEKRAVIETGIKAFINNEPIAAIYILVPQIEDAIRQILVLQKKAVFKKNRNGRVNLKTLEELLREKSIINVLGDDTAFYLRVLLTDPRGLNLRNDLCHGTIDPVNLSMNTGDIVFCILLILSEVQFFISGQE